MAIGLLTALASGKVLAVYPFGVRVWDPLTLVGVTLTLLGATAGAAFIPALRASGVETSRALVQE